jgi:Peptidase family M48
MKVPRTSAPWASLALLLLPVGCQPAASGPPPQSPPAPGTYGPAPYPPAPAGGWSYGAPAPASNAYPYPPPPAPTPNAAPYPAPAPNAAPYPAPAPTPAPVSPAANRPLLGPLVGSLAWQAEVRAVAKELVANLSAEYQPRVANVPIVFDPNPNDVNAFASCDNSGAPFVAATEGLLDAVDAISQTRATDELFGTQTYQAYANAVSPAIASKGGGSALLPAGIIAPAYVGDPRRISRAHEIFDETVAFTFGHELSHHYLGHTGCAMQQAGALPQAIAQLGQFLTSGPASFNQPNEMVADNFGCRNTLDAGRARSTVAYRWTENGGLWLLDFFKYLSRAGGATPLVSILLSHPDPSVRIPLVQAAAASWRLQHP